MDRALGTDPRSALAATLVTAAFVAIPLYVAPTLANAYIAQLGFRIDQPGYVIAAEMAGMGLATFPAWWWVGRVPWNRLATAMFLCIAIGAAASTVATTPAALAIVRFVTGLAEGTVSIICMSALRRTRDPNRSFGLWLFAQLAAGALVLAIMPTLLASVGVRGFFAVFAVLAVAFAWPASGIQDGHGQVQSTNAHTGGIGAAWSLAGGAGLAAILSFYIAFGAIWTCVGQLARLGGLSPAEGGYALSLAPIGGMFGAALASVVGLSAGRFVPLSLGMVAFIAAVWAAGSGLGWRSYAVGAFGVMLAWTFVVSYLLGNLAAVDRGGRLTVIVNVLIGAGLTLGPMLAGVLVAAFHGYSAVVGFSVALCAGSFLLSLPTLRAVASARAATLA